jgi:hypothetical protein
VGTGALNAEELHQGEIGDPLSRVGSWYLQGNLAVFQGRLRVLQGNLAVFQGRLRVLQGKRQVLRVLKFFEGFFIFYFFRFFFFFPSFSPDFSAYFGIFLQGRRSVLADLGYFSFLDGNLCRVSY